MRTLGIDPGTIRTGYGVIEERRGGGLTHIDNGIIAPNTSWPFADRLHTIGAQLRELVREFKPQALSIEALFFAKNAQSAMKLAHARGVAMFIGAECGLAVFEYTAGQIKQATVGSGRADKAQVQTMVRMILGLPEVAQEDASDALAAAICHQQYASSPALALLQGATQKRVRGMA